jgi:hypothetical protein
MSLFRLEEEIFWLELDSTFLLEEDCLLLLDPSLLLRTTEEDEETALTEDEEVFSEDEDDFLTLELDGDPGTESGMTSEGEVPLSPPQAMRAMDRIMDTIMLFLKFLILNLVHIPNFFIETI